MRKQTSHLEENCDRELAPTERKHIKKLQKPVQTLREEMELLFILFIHLKMEKNSVDLKGKRPKKLRTINLFFV